MPNTMNIKPIDTEVSMIATKRQAKPLIAKLDTIAQFEAEARRLAGRVSENQLRFLKVPKPRARKWKPTGRMAGARA